MPSRKDWEGKSRTPAPAWNTPWPRSALARVRSVQVGGRTGCARTLPVRFLRSFHEALREVEQAAGADKPVLYIRNTVDDVLDAHTALTARGFKPQIFHARLALVDRLAIEKQVVERFGKRSTPAGRKGQVLIATQVVEQSLDLDFDALITDLAPVDLLIQRAGRLWRHDRPERAGQPELLVVGPEPIADAGGEWFSRAFPRAKYVYRDHARLWLTARVLEDTGVIESPAGLRALIESVYGDDAEAPLPDALQGRFFDAEGRAGAERGAATTNVLNLAKGYVRDGGRLGQRRSNANPDRRRSNGYLAARSRPWRLHRTLCSQRRAGRVMARVAAQRSKRLGPASWGRGRAGGKCRSGAGGEGELDTVRKG